MLVGGGLKEVLKRLGCCAAGVFGSYLDRGILFTWLSLCQSRATNILVLRTCLMSCSSAGTEYITRVKSKKLADPNDCNIKRGYSPPHTHTLASVPVMKSERLLNVHSEMQNEKVDVSARGPN